MSADLYGYKKAHPAFPGESTEDPFFDEKQFVAYRELGSQAAWQMMNDRHVVLYKAPARSPSFPCFAWER